MAGRVKGILPGCYWLANRPWRLTCVNLRNNGMPIPPMVANPLAPKPAPSHTHPVVCLPTVSRDLGCGFVPVCILGCPWHTWLDTWLLPTLFVRRIPSVLLCGEGHLRCPEFLITRSRASTTRRCLRLRLDRRPHSAPADLSMCRSRGPSDVPQRQTAISKWQSPRPLVNGARRPWDAALAEKQARG